jgi:hypothetical protein
VNISILRSNLITIIEINKGIKMTIHESNQCLEAFNASCEALSQSDLVETEECQYWLFELGYKAALEKLNSHTAQPQT